MPVERKWKVILLDEERGQLKGVASKSNSPQKRNRARILIMSDRGCTDRVIAESVKCHVTTVERVRRSYALHGLKHTINPTHRIPDPMPDQRRRGKVTPKVKAALIDLSLRPPQAGHKRWSFRVLAKELIASGVVDSISHETVRRVLNKQRQK